MMFSVRRVTEERACVMALLFERVVVVEKEVQMHAELRESQKRGGGRLSRVRPSSTFTFRTTYITSARLISSLRGDRTSLGVSVQTSERLLEAKYTAMQSKTPNCILS